MNSRSLALAASATVVASGAAGSRADAPSPVRGGGACVWAITYMALQEDTDIRYFRFPRLFSRLRRVCTGGLAVLGLVQSVGFGMMLASFASDRHTTGFLGASVQ